MRDLRWLKEPCIERNADRKINTISSVPFGGRPRWRAVVVVASGGGADAGAGAGARAGAVSTVCATGMQGMSGEAEKAHDN